MKTRSKIITGNGALVTCAFLLLGLACFQLSGQPVPGVAPIYQGQPLRFWLTELTKHGEFDPTPPERAIAAVREIGPTAVPFLIEWWPKSESDQEPPVNSEAIIAAFRVLGPNARSALPNLANTLGTMRDYESWHTASEAIPWMGPAAIPVMLAAVTNLDGIHERWELIKQFGIFRSNGVPAIPALIAWVHDKDSYVRAGAVSALGGIGQQPGLVLAVLRTAASGDPDWMVRRDAAKSLGSFGAVVIPDLVRANNDTNGNVRTGAMAGLGKLAVEKPDVVLPLLEQGLRDDNWIIRRSAAYALGFSGSKAAYIKLMAATNDDAIGDIVDQCRTIVRPEKLK